MILVTGGAGFIGSHIVDALVAAGTRCGCSTRSIRRAHASAGLPRTAVELIRGDVRDPDAVRAALRGVDAVCHQAAMVGLGVDLSRRRATTCATTTSGTAVLLRALAAARFAGRLVLASSMVVYGEGRYRLRRRTGSCGRRPRAPRRTSTPAASSRPARAAVAPWTRGRCPRTRRSTRATSTPRPSCTRSTSARRSPARPACPSPRCATTTSTGRGCPATRRTPASPRSSPARWRRAARRACSRTAASCATSSTSATSPAPTCSRSPDRSRGPAPSTSPAARRARR